MKKEQVFWATVYKDWLYSKPLPKAFASGSSGWLKGKAIKGFILFFEKKSCQEAKNGG